MLRNVQIEIEEIDQISNGNEGRVKSGFMPRLTYTPYIRFNNEEDWYALASFNSKEEAYEKAKMYAEQHNS